MRDFLEYAITVEMIAIATKPSPQDAIRDQPLIDTASRGLCDNPASPLPKQSMVANRTDYSRSHDANLVMRTHP